MEATDVIVEYMWPYKSLVYTQCEILVVLNGTIEKQLMVAMLLECLPSTSQAGFLLNIKLAFCCCERIADEQI